MIINESGGGAGLNLKVVGGTAAPSSPKGNTVWVNTDTEINGYAFSTTQPTGPVEGMVWFQTGTASSAAMNIDKKDTVMLYPGGCSQYIGGAWVEKDAQTYLNGQWVDWRTYFYNKGDECTDLTGGWTIRTETNGRGSKNSNSIRLYNVSTASLSSAEVSTMNKIDLTDVSTLFFELETSYGYCCGVTDSPQAANAYLHFHQTSPYLAVVADEKVSLSRTTVELDVSNITGKHYIEICTSLGDLFLYDVYSKN